MRRTKASMMLMGLPLWFSSGVSPAAGPGETPMVMTVLEARVPGDRLANVELVFRQGMSPVPPEIVETFLVRDTKDPALFRLTTVWRSMKDLQAMRESGVKPKGVQMFEAVGAEPTLSIWEVDVYSHR